MADLLLLGFWFLASEDDPSSPSYVPDDWKHLVLANLGIAQPVTVPAEYTGVWEGADGELFGFDSRGRFTHTEHFPHTSEVKIQSNGSVFSSEDGYVTVKTTTVERIKIDRPVQSVDGNWALVIDGKVYRKSSKSPSL